MKDRIKVFAERWKRVKSTSRFRNFLLYAVFVAIAALFWFVLALNDNVQRSFDVGIRISGVPDSVTFISDIPDKIHVSVRDKGTGLLRSTGFRKPVMDISFKEYADMPESQLRVSRNEMTSLLRKLFGSSAQISALSTDSLLLSFTDLPGKRVPVVVDAEIKAASGYVVSGKARLSQSYTRVYGPPSILDTITRVYTDRIVRRDLSETTNVDASLRPVAGVRLIPARIKVTLPVEPLVIKHANVGVDVVNVPEGSSVLLFPQKAEVSYYVPMSKFNDAQTGIEIVAYYASRGFGISGRIPVKVRRVPQQCVNLSLLTDSLEYTVIR